ncbi:MAG: hypothetical protein WCP21_03370 [Armatimonadota bacterium]
MTSKLRVAHVVIGLVLMVGASQVWGFVMWMLLFHNGANGIRQFDLRPFRFGGQFGQLWFGRLLEWGWPLLSVAGLVLLVIGLRNKPCGPRRARWLMGWVLFAGVFLAITASSPNTAQAYIPIASLGGVQRLFDVEFPPGTQLVKAGLESGIDSAPWAIMTMPTPAVVPFVKGVFLRSVKTEYSGEPELRLSWDTPEGVWKLPPRVEDWQPEKAKRPLTAWVSAENGMRAALVADLADAGTATVYLHR